MAAAPPAPVLELEGAINVVRQAASSTGPSSEWSSTLANRLRGTAESNLDVRRILERNGWSSNGSARIGGQFRSPPDRQRLLRELQAQAAALASPSEDRAHQLEEKRFADQYSLEEVKPLGEGTYGTVYKATDRRSGAIVAVKRVKPDHGDEGVPSTAIREVAVLKSARHPNIVRLLDVCCTPGRLHLVFEYVPMNLKQHMKRFGMKLDQPAVQSLMHQLMLGTEFCHSRRIVHRDLKPQNVLMDNARPGGDGLLKIADFGMARAFCVPLPRYTHEVVTTWYRAPEILFGVQEYSLPVDVWSTGCILGEMATGSALFHGDSEIDTIFQIFKKLGTPTDVEWPGLSELPDFKPTFPKWRRKPWEEIRGAAAHLGPAGVSLIDDLLRYDPLRRLSAKASLASPYFDAVRGPTAMEAEVAVA